ncbi:hypothetical protein CAEBREN_16679 [Caenorhabditis brenneri]|uniref:Uncharacterized protein n=1 Tax=Caenorhabditis brenneri TaxID=135651 RepID=G0N2K8_CAEBE|nr:hypothetical protein CAEBREN_16679 [Caenorhabditis brenneri]
MTEVGHHNLLAVCNYVFRLLRKLGFEPKSASFDDLSVFFLRNERELRSLGKSSGTLKILRQFMDLISRRRKECGLLDNVILSDDQQSTRRCEIDIIDILDELHAKDDDVADDDSDDETYLRDLREQIYRQRTNMNQIAQGMLNKEIEPITDEQWKEDDNILNALVVEYNDEQHEDADIQIEELEVRTAQLFLLQPQNRGLFDKSVQRRLAPHEVVIEKLLMFDNQPGRKDQKHCIRFVEAHFQEKEEFLDFLIKICPTDGWLDTPKLKKKPELKEGDDEQSLKKRLFDEIVKSCIGSPWFLHSIRKVIRFDLLPKEEDFINRYVSDEPKEEFESEMLQQFSIEELNNLEQKLTVYCTRALQYKIWANGQEVLKRCFDTVAKDCEPLPYFPMYPPNTRALKRKKDREDELRLSLQFAIHKKIVQSKSLDVFMLDPEIIDILSCEEKMLFVCISILKSYDDVPTYPLGILQGFMRKLNGFERRMKAENICYCMLPHCEHTIAYQRLKESERSPIWMPRDIFQLVERRRENIVLLSIFNQLDKILFYDMHDPLYREQFNKDFKFLFLNRHLVLSANLGPLSKGTNTFKESYLMAFYTEIVNPDPKVEPTVLKDYIDEIEDKIDADRWKRAEILNLIKNGESEDAKIAKISPPPELDAPKDLFVPKPFSNQALDDIQARLRQTYPSTDGELPLLFDASRQLRPRSAAALEGTRGLTLREKRLKK